MAGLPPPSLPREALSGLVLAGGLGRRMGGVAKGLQAWQGEPLAAAALRRLAPQVGPLMLNANAQLEEHARLGVPVLRDPALEGVEAHAGPLAGMLAGLEAASTPWLLAVPCDAPAFPEDLGKRLAAAALAAAAPLARPRVRDPAGAWRPEPAFCLLHRRLAPALRRFLLDGGRRAEDWARRAGGAVADFDDAGAFLNLNTLDALAAAQAARRPAAPTP